MKTKNIFLLIILLLLGCSNNDGSFKDDSAADTEKSGNQNISLTGTKWKLTALVDVQTRESIEPEPKECNTCYTLEFDSDTTAMGRSIVNTLHFIVTDSNIDMFLMTEIGDSDQGNVTLFYEALLTLDTYECSKDELKIYYDKKNKYLLYKPLLQ